MKSDQDDQWVRNYRGVTIKIKDGTVISGKLNIGLLLSEGLMKDLGP